MKVLHSELEYTGGGNWGAYGELEDGTIFVGGNNEGFGIYGKEILDIVWLTEDWEDPIDIYDATERVEQIRSTADDSEETFNMWVQIYDQHPDGLRTLGNRKEFREYMLNDLYEFFGKTRQ